MNINKEEMWPECNRILAEIIDTQKLQQEIMVHIESFSHSKQQIWAHIFEDILRNKIFGTPLPTIPSYWEAQVIIMESMIPNQFVEKCKELCSDFDDEITLLFKYYWIEAFSFLNTMAQLKSGNEIINLSTSMSLEESSRGILLIFINLIYFYNLRLERLCYYREKVVNDFGSLGIVGAGFTFSNSNLYYIASLIKN